MQSQMQMLYTQSVCITHSIVENACLTKFCSIDKKGVTSEGAGERVKQAACRVQEIADRLAGVFVEMKKLCCKVCVTVQCRRKLKSSTRIERLVRYLSLTNRSGPPNFRPRATL